MKHFILPLMLFSFFTVKAHDYNVMDFGVKPDGKTICTKAIQNAIDKSSAEGGILVFPKGEYLTGTLFLKDNTTIKLEKDARILGSTSLSDYPQTTVDFRFWGDMWTYQALIIAHNVQNITIEGSGIIDGQGKAFPVKTMQKPDRYRDRPYLLWVAESTNILVKGIELRNSAMWMQSYIRCDRLRIEDIKVYNHANKNNDLMDIDGCKDVIITRVTGDSDDDGITFKSTTDRIAENIIVSDCIISSHCNALKFGTETTAGFRNITISNCIIKKSSVGTALTGFPEGICGIALEMVDGGILENVIISNIVVDGPRVPLFIRLGNRARKHYQEAPEPSVGFIRNVVLNNITATASENTGCVITGIPERKIEGITISNSRFIFPGGIKDDLSNKKIEELPDLYPESTMFGTLPAFGIFARHVDHLNLQGLSFKFQDYDCRPAIICDDVHGGNIQNIVSNGNKKADDFILIHKNCDL